MYVVTTAASGGGVPCEAAHGATSACLPGDGACVQAVDCVGSWSRCTSACGAKLYTVSVAAAGAGSPCPSAHGDSAACRPGEDSCPPNFDCVGEWSTCTSACETAAERNWREVWAPSGAGTACPPAEDCQYGDGSCEQAVDCEGSWSVCAADCGHKRFTVSVAASGGGAACTARDGDTSSCAPGEDSCPPNVDCFGEWSTCTASCESAAQRIWLEAVAQSGAGAACPAASDCEYGQDLCPQPDVDCVGYWSACSEACESAGQRVWHETTTQTGFGRPCPLAADCEGGQDNCPHVINCEGYWSVCAPDCNRTYHIGTEANSRGAPCEQPNGKREACAIGEGFCTDDPSQAHVELPPDHCAIRCPDYYRGNGRCDAACDVEECGHDGGDCAVPAYFLGLRCPPTGCGQMLVGLGLFCAALVAIAILVVCKCGGQGGFDPGRRGSSDSTEWTALQDSEMMRIQDAVQRDRATPGGTLGPVQPGKRWKDARPLKTSSPGPAVGGEPWHSPESAEDRDDDRPQPAAEEAQPLVSERPSRPAENGSRALFSDDAEGGDDVKMMFRV